MYPGMLWMCPLQITIWHGDTYHPPFMGVCMGYCVGQWVGSMLKITRNGNNSETNQDNSILFEGHWQNIFVFTSVPIPDSPIPPTPLDYTQISNFFQ